MNAARITVLVIGLVLAFVAAAEWFGAHRWAGETLEIRASILASEKAGHEGINFENLKTLPPPVQRYLRKVLKEGQPPIVNVRVAHTGELNMGEVKDNWKQFTSDQLVVPSQPGFDWNARVRLMPGVEVRVHDSYSNGKGFLHAAVLGLFTVAKPRGGGPIAEAELMRFLAEAAWYPTMLMPNNGVTWRSVDDTSALATLTDKSVSVTLLFTFNENDLLSGIDAESRSRTVGNKDVPAPWHGRFWDYEERSGILIPLQGEISWLLAAGPRTYWRGRITRIKYAFAPPRFSEAKPEQRLYLLPAVQ